MLTGHPDGWPKIARDAWGERAAILQYDAGMSRRDAEREAWHQVRAQFSQEKYNADHD